MLSASEYLRNMAVTVKSRGDEQLGQQIRTVIRRAAGSEQKMLDGAVDVLRRAGRPDLVEQVATYSRRSRKPVPYVRVVSLLDELGFLNLAEAIMAAMERPAPTASPSVKGGRSG